MTIAKMLHSIHCNSTATSQLKAIQAATSNSPQTGHSCATHPTPAQKIISKPLADTTTSKILQYLLAKEPSLHPTKTPSPPSVTPLPLKPPDPNLSTATVFSTSRLHSKGSYLNPSPPPVTKSSTDDQYNTSPHHSSSSSVQFDSLLQHLLHLSTPPEPLQTPRNRKSTSLSVIEFDVQAEEALPRNGSLEFLSAKCKLVLNSIMEQPLQNLNAFFDASESELLQLDLVSLLTALDLSGHWGKALLLFEWTVLHLSSSDVKAFDNQVIELMVRILGRESQHSVASKLLDVIPLDDYVLDVRAYTTILHAYSRSGNYLRAIEIFEKMNQSGLAPTLVTYNVMLDVYGKMGRSWDKILSLLAEMRSRGLEFDEFTYSTVISACGREGLLAEAKDFFCRLKSQGYVSGTVTYNALLQVFGKAGIYSEAVNILKEMEDNNCPTNAVIYNELVAAYVRAGFYEEGANVIDTMTSKGVMPNVVTYTTVINAYDRAGKMDEALGVFQHMKESGVVPNVCTYNAILAMLATRCSPPDKLSQVATMEDREEQSVVLHDPNSNRIIMEQAQEFDYLLEQAITSRKQLAGLKKFNPSLSNQTSAFMMIPIETLPRRLVRRQGLPATTLEISRIPEAYPRSPLWSRESSGGVLSCALSSADFKIEMRIEWRNVNRSRRERKIRKKKENDKSEKDAELHVV